MSWPTQFLHIGNRTIPTEEFVKNREEILEKYSNVPKQGKWQMLHKEDIVKKEVKVEEKIDVAVVDTTPEIVDPKEPTFETVVPSKTTPKKAKRWK